MDTRKRHWALIGAALLAAMACTSPDRRAAIDIDMRAPGDANPQRFAAGLDLGPVALSLRLTWSERG